ncbi:MAG TPA: TIGR03086 family metal-binding protein [Nocardioides sp.]|nr:TIGR03086 family metal-binding protein [Nocardioides sp.]
MELIDFGPATATMRRLVLGTRDDQLGDPTPCGDYTVGDLVQHVGGLTLAFTGAAHKQPVPGADQGGTGDASKLETGWRLLIARDLEVLTESWRNPTAYQGSTMAGPVELPGSEAAVVALNEVVVHGWDLATATGQRYAVDPTSLAICTEFARAFSTPETADQRGDAFGPVIEVPEDAPALTRLLGMMGRRADWRAPHAVS